MNPATKKRNRQAIRKLLGELEDVLDAFGWHDISGGVSNEHAAVKPEAEEAGQTPVEAPGPGSMHPQDSVQSAASDQEEEEEEYLDGDDSEEPFHDPWDIQSALDQAISNLLKDNLIPEFADAKKAPAFSEVAGVLFGKEHELTKQAEYFEELISGYEDRVSKEDLREAYSVLESMMEELGWKQASK